MPYCPKCGTNVDEKMAFCPRCGGSLRAETTAKPAPVLSSPREEKAEKQEKQEKEEQEKGEKHEKGEFGFISWLVGGAVLIIIGIFTYIQLLDYVSSGLASALAILTIGVLIVIVAVYMGLRSRKQYPRT
ncbi:zinc ribbon domain-containing protein [Candidatus Bathyarchaeota archaeon]|nr:zinc ribbon domain-containing protein [Candidatus Bathyarchaeota archaeon]